MTKHPDLVKGAADRPVIEIEITEEMAQAGRWALLHWSACSDEYDYELMARSIYRIMEAVRLGLLSVHQVTDGLTQTKAEQFFRDFA